MTWMEKGRFIDFAEIEIDSTIDPQLYVFLTKVSLQRSSSIKQHPPYILGVNTYQQSVICQIPEL